MRFPEYDSLDALGLAALIGRREVSAAEALEAALARADARNPALNAIVERYDDEARRRECRACYRDRVRDDDGPIQFCEECDE